MANTDKLVTSKLIGIIGGIFFHSVILAQTSDQDSLGVSDPQFRYLNRCFENLIPNPILDSLEAVYGFRYCNLAACFEPYFSRSIGARVLNAIKDRLEDIATILVKEGTPILLSVGGSNSYENAKQMNQVGNPYNIVYVSFGNYCVIEKNDAYLENVFNEKTQQLLGIPKPLVDKKHNKKRN